MVEARDAKGSGWSVCTRLEHFTDEAGSEAAGNAVAAIDGARVESGDYTVVFGPQPVADLCNNLIVPSCQAGSFFASSTPFLGAPRPLGRRGRGSASTTTGPCRASRAPGASPARACPPDGPT